MANQWSTAAKNAALDAAGATCDLLSLHSGDPGVAGTSNEISGGSPAYARKAATFDAAANGERALNADVTFDGPSLQAVSWVGFWKNAGTVFLARAPLTGDAAFNADGEYVVKGTTTKLTIGDPP